MLFKAGVQKCDGSFVNDSKTKIAHSSLGANHPIYQNILSSEFLDTILMPRLFNDIKEKYLSGSRTGNAVKSQGRDVFRN